MKTRLYTRKRALISSVAMLLVAMIALGTATFAWFTSRPDANATGLTLKATAANGLVILTETHENYIKSASGFKRDVKTSDWVHDDFLNYTYDKGTETASTSSTPYQLDSTSFNLGLTNNVFSDAYRVTAKEDNDYIAENTAIVSKLSDKTGFYQEIIKCKVTGVKDNSKEYKVRVSGLSVDPTEGLSTEGADLLKSARIALEYKDSSTGTKEAPAAYKLVGVYSLNSDGSSNKYLTNGGATVQYSAALSSTNKAFTYLDTSDVNVHDNTNGYDGVRVGNVGTDGTDMFRLTIYLDGEDVNCKSSNFTVSDLFSNVELNLYLDTPDKA